MKKAFMFTGERVVHENVGSFCVEIQVDSRSTASSTDSKMVSSASIKKSLFLSGFLKVTLTFSFHIHVYYLSIYFVTKQKSGIHQVRGTSVASTCPTANKSCTATDAAAVRRTITDTHSAAPTINVCTRYTIATRLDHLVSCQHLVAFSDFYLDCDKTTREESNLDKTVIILFCVQEHLQHPVCLLHPHQDYNLQRQM